MSSIMDSLKYSVMYCYTVSQFELFGYILLMKHLMHGEQGVCLIWLHVFCTKTKHLIVVLNISLLFQSGTHMIL